MRPLITALASLAVALFLLALNLRRAARCLLPRARVEADAPADQMQLPRRLEPLAAQLRALGFLPLGTHEEQLVLAPSLRLFDFARADAPSPAFASLHLSPDEEPRVDFWTPLEGGGWVLTAGYARPVVERPGRYRAGGLEGAPLERVFKAHLKRVEGLGARGDFTWEGRVRMARGFWAGEGRRELRRQNLPALLWCAGAVAILLSALWGWAGSFQ